jgi:bifunctional non-homologous end joining protein LigD
VVSPSARPPAGDDWLHEIKHDGHRLAAIFDGDGGLKLISRRGYDRTPLFRAPFRELFALGREIVLDGEIAVPDDRGVTHISDLQDAIEQRRPERLAYFAFDLLHLEGHDLRGRKIEDRKELLRHLLYHGGGPRLVYVDHVTGHGAELFEHVRAVGAEGIVSKRLGPVRHHGVSGTWAWPAGSPSRCGGDRGWAQPCGAGAASGSPARGYGRRWMRSGLAPWAALA